MLLSAQERTIYFISQVSPERGKKKKQWKKKKKEKEFKSLFSYKYKQEKANCFGNISVSRSVPV